MAERPSYSATETGQSHPLDGRIARLVAVAVAVGTACLLMVIHRDSIWPGAEAETGPASPFAACLAERRADIAQMRADGVVDDARLALFTERAEALCHAQNPE